jgi:hypothetical protein
MIPHDGTQKETARMCPFCPLFLPQHPELWQEVGYDYHGEIPAQVGGVRSCDECAVIIRMFRQEQDYLYALAVPIADFFTALSQYSSVLAVTGQATSLSHQ